MRNSKTFLALVLLVLIAVPAIASVGIKANGTPHGAAENLNLTCGAGADCATQTGVTRNIPVLDSNLAQAGVGNAGAVSVASTTAAVPANYAFVRKVITSNGDAAFTNGTLANGKPGQLLTVYVVGISPSGATTGGSYKITPTTSTGFTSVTLTAVNDRATFEYVDTTTGWVLMGYNGTVTIVLKN